MVEHTLGKGEVTSSILVTGFLVCKGSIDWGNSLDDSLCVCGQNIATKCTMKKRLPKIKPENRNGYIRLRWCYLGKRYTLSGLGRYDDPLDMSITQSVIGQIKRDIQLGTFDPSLRRYTQNHRQNEEAIDAFIEESNRWGLDDVWGFYKEVNQVYTPLTTQKNHWVAVDNAIKKLSPEQLDPKQSDTVVGVLMGHYSVGTLHRVLPTISAASTLAFRNGKISKNYWRRLKAQLPKGKKESKRTQKAYSVDEVTAILEAFKRDRYCPNKNAYSHSYYYRFVEFLVLTGCRPGEAIALTWGDIEGEKIRFNKSYSLGVLKSTKNGKTRYFPINEQLKECLAMQHRNPRSYNSLNLVFPSFKSGYINLYNFTTKVFNRIVNGLFNDGIIRQKLPTYNLRNTSASLYLRKGIDRATIAKLFETSGEMLDKHYFSPDEDVELPGINS